MINKMNKNGKIGVTSENIFPVIKKFLYSEHDIFLRELVSNAVDATEKLKAVSSSENISIDKNELKVLVSFDADKKTITISDRGIGMTAEEVDKYINQIAFSGAEEFLDKYKDDKVAIIGHFGLGFYSSFMVSERVDIITKSYKEGSKAVKWSCDGSPEYTIEEIDKSERGTDIVLHIDDESKEFLSKNKLEELLNKYCKFLTVPVIFGKKQEWKDGKMQDTEEDNQINNTSPAWTKKPSDLKDEDYKAFYRELYPNQFEEPLFWIHLNVDYPFNLTGILYFPKIKNQMELQRNKIQLYCNQVFVTEEVSDIVPEYLTLLHGVIDSPDIPLNVSRSYLQSDAQVKKISNHITKKVADKLEEIFKKDRTLFEDKWESLKIFIQYGMLSDEKFYDRASKFVLLTDIDGKKFTLEEYKELIKQEQTDKDDHIVYLYTTNKESQYSHIQRAIDKGYSVLVMDGPLDIHAVSQFEHKFEKSKFVRVDSEPIHKLIVKDDNKEVGLSESERASLDKIFLGRIPDNDKKHYNIQFESLGKDAEPIIITQNEFMRRMQDMSKINPSMSFYGEMPESYNIVINTDSRVVLRVLEESKSLDGELEDVRKELAEITKEVERMKEEQKDKKEEEISAEDKKVLEDKKFEQATVEGKINNRLKEYGKTNDLVGQLIDLALLGSGLLVGEALSRFIRRSQNML